MNITVTPKPPYYAVIFTSIHTDKIEDKYNELNDNLMDKITNLPGFLGVDSVRTENKVGITTIYFKDLESIREWRKDSDHKYAKDFGKDLWYENYNVRIAKVEKEYGKI